MIYNDKEEKLKAFFQKDDTLKIHRRNLQILMEEIYGTINNLYLGYM